MLNHLTTEQRNPDSEAIDSCSAREIVELMNREDAQVAVRGRYAGGCHRRGRGPASWTACDVAGG